MKATCTEHYFPVVPLIVLCKVVQAFELVDEILKCDHSLLFIRKLQKQYFSVVLYIVLCKVVLTF